VRELYNAVQRAYVMTASAVIDMQWLPIGPTVTPLLSADQPTASLPAKAPVAADAADATVTLPIGVTMAQMERTMILATMAHCQNHRERAAAILGISLKTLYNRLKDYAAQDASGNETH
jgi:DNA-binding NtrC family response regulator